MSVNRGKDFEAEVQGALERAGAYVLRLYDPQGGYVGVANPCDFVAYKGRQMFMLECKAIHKDLLSINSNDPKRKYGNVSNRQWEGMLDAAERGGVVAGVLCWWIDRDVTKFIPIQKLQELKEQGNKSVRYDIEGVYEIEGKKKRIFFDYDFSTFFEKF